LVDGKEARWDPVSGAGLKKNKKALQTEQKKAEKVGQASAKAEDDAKAQAEETARRFEEAKSIVLEEDKSLPAAKTLKIRDLEKHRGSRVKVFGWLDRIRTQGKAFIFVVLRDGTGYLQSILQDKNVPFPCGIISRAGFFNPFIV